MRFRQAHKTTTYAVALSAFFAVAFSGLFHPVLMLASFLGIIGSWYWEPPRIRYERWNLAWTVLAVLVFVYELLSVLAAGAEIILAGSSFLVFLMLVKLFNRQESKDYLHIYVLSFLMLTAGTVLNAEITYGFFFLCYVVSSTWALTIFQLRRELESNFLLRHTSKDDSERVRVERVMNSKRIVGRKFFVGTAMVSLVVFASALSLFLLFPRVGFGLFFDKGRGGITMAGFNDGVQLGGHGLIKKDTTVVMRVQVDEAYEGRGAPYLHWRGVAFDTYADGRWTRSRKAPITEQSVDPGRRTTTHHLLYAGRKPRSRVLRQRKNAGLRQEIYLEPVGNDVLFGASMPLAFEFETKHRSKTHAGQNDELRRRRSAGTKYTVFSDPEPPSPALLRQAPAGVPPGYEVYLRLPEEIPACAKRSADLGPEELDLRCRVRDLARRITRDATTNYDKAVALESWLRSKLDYTLQMESPGDMEPVEFFLFERKKGHCEYFSSAMAIMARSVGVPTRNVNGFHGGEWNEIGDYISVRAGDAHSWVEVYFEGHGWVTFDPTPGGEADMLGRGSSGFLDRMRRIADTVRFKWFKWVIEYDLYAQLKLFRNFGKRLKGGAKKYFKSPLKSAKDWAKRQKAKAAIVVLVIGVLVLLLTLRRKRADTNRSLAPRAAERARDPVVGHYLAALRALAKRGYRRDESTTPREFATRLGEAKTPGARSLQELTELYYRAEYGPSGGSNADRARALKARLFTELKEQKVKRRKTAGI